MPLGIVFAVIETKNFHRQEKFVLGGTPQSVLKGMRFLFKKTNSSFGKFSKSLADDEAILSFMLPSNITRATRRILEES